jgi:mono/diheme cytochrome c family protein
MPSDFYEIITENDLNAIVAYLRTVKPVKQVTPTPEYRIALPRHIAPGAEKPFTEADMADKVKKGFYLATIGHCFECHTPMGPKGREFETGYGAGGFDFPGPWGKSTSRNITSSKEKGIGAWSDAEIKRAITQGIGRDGRRLIEPMPFAWYAAIHDDDLDAIVAFLRTLPPLAR